jgi:tetratricopeptide (TPR) repeat protein
MRIVFALWLTLLIGSAAFAQDNKKDAAKKQEEAKQLFAEAEANYNIQEYTAALELYKKAYLLSLQPGLLFNIGQCHRQLKQYEEAIKSYKSYLRQSPTTPIKDHVEKVIKETEELWAIEKTKVIEPTTKTIEPVSEPSSLVTSQPASTPTSQALETPATSQASSLPTKFSELPQRDNSPHALVYGLYGGAAFTGALSGAAGFLFLSARTKANELRDQNDVTLAEGVEFFANRAKTFGTISNALVGVSLLSAGTGLLISKKQKSKELQSKATISPSGVALSGSF